MANFGNIQIGSHAGTADPVLAPYDSVSQSHDVTGYTKDLIGINSTDSPGENSTTPCINDYCISLDDYIDQVGYYIFPTPFEWVLIGLYIIVFIVGLTGNFLVCFAVWRNQHMRTVTNLFIVNLAIADFMVLLICLPTTVLGDVTETWYLGMIMCKIIQYLQGVSVSVSVLTLSVISIERWYAICQPLKFKSTLTRARIMILVIWLLGMGILIPDLFVLEIAHHPNLPPDRTILLTSCRPNWGYNSQATYEFFKMMALYIVPCCLMGYTYGQIVKCLWSNSIPTATVSSSSRPGVKTGMEYQLTARRKAAKMLIAVVAMFAICYLPVHLLNILRDFVTLTPCVYRIKFGLKFTIKVVAFFLYDFELYGNLGKPGDIVRYISQRGIRYAKSLPDSPWTTNFALLAHYVCYFNSAINPVIYNFMSAKFRKEFRKTCYCCSAVCYCAKRSRTRRPCHGESMYSYKYTNDLSQTEQITMTTMRHNLTRKTDKSNVDL